MNNNMTPQQIKFRGFRVDGKGWVTGLPISNEERSFWAIKWYVNGVPYISDIHPSSLGMFTGLTDKNGKEIYGAIGERGGDVDQSGRVVVYDRGSFILTDNLSGEYALIGDCEFCEIIGNQWEVDNGKV